MRNLAIVGCLVLFCGLVSAQDLKRMQFATDPPATSTPATTPVDSQLPPPAPIVVPGVPAREYEPQQLLRMNECQLIEVYKCGRVTPVPCGYTPGVVIYKPGSKLAVPMSKLMKVTAWQGKWVKGGKMINRQFGIPSIEANIGFGESWIDGGPTQIFDYTDTSLICNKYRDEVREVSPGVYLGCMHKREKDGVRIATWFALDARCESRGCLTGK